MAFVCARGQCDSNANLGSSAKAPKYRSYISLMGLGRRRACRAFDVRFSYTIEIVLLWVRSMMNWTEECDDIASVQLASLNGGIKLEQ